MKAQYYFMILSLFLTLSCHEKGKYLTSPDGKHHLTLFEQSDSRGKSYTFLVYGKAKKRKMTDSYIKIRNRHSDAWYCLIAWEDSKAIIYHPYSTFTGQLLGDKMKLVEMKDKEFSKIFFSNKDDQYYRLSSSNKDEL